MRLARRKSIPTRIASLRSALLRCARLRSALLRSTLRRCAPLRSTLLKSTLLRSASLRCAPLRSASLTLTFLRCAPLRSAPLRWALLRSAPLRSALLTSAPLRMASLRWALLRCAPLRSAPLRRASLRSASLRCALLRIALLRSARLRSALLRSASLRIACLRSASLRIAPVRFTLRRSASARGALLRGAPRRSIPTSGCWCLQAFHARTSCFSLCRESQYAMSCPSHVRHAETSPPWGREEGIAIEQDCTTCVASKPLPAVSPAAWLGHPLQQTCRFRLQARIEGAVHTEQTISDHQRQHRLRVAPPVALDKRKAITFMIDRRPLTEGLCPTNNWIGGRGAVSLTAVFAGMPIASKA